ncbi:MAG: hypothetical protein M3467_04060, partial [Actinomycetota bacterium]|nr:hypothetical protein [Actinomycetota bacterium]
EAADDRIARLATYARLPGLIREGMFGAVAEQDEGGQSPLQHMRDVETAESGRLFAARGSVDLVFQGRDVRYNPASALTLDYADLETGDVRYAKDDQKLVNALTSSRPGGATQRVASASSMLAYGTYEPPALELLKVTDLEVTDAAHWTILRYADPAHELRNLPVEGGTLPLADYRALLGADISSVLTVTDLPDQAPAPTVSLMVEGYTETITEGQHRWDFYTSRAQTDAVWVLDDPVYSALGTTTRLAY